MLPSVGLFLAGLFIPVLVVAICSLVPMLRELHDRVVLPVVFGGMLPFGFLIVAVCFLLSLVRQDADGWWKKLVLFLLGLNLGLFAAFDCWYFAPLMLLLLAAMSLWRFRCLWWSRKQGVAGLTLLTLVVVIGCVALDRRGFLPVVDNRCGLGMPEPLHTLSLVALLSGIAVVCFLWLRSYLANCDDDNRALLIDIVMQDPRCIRYFDAVKKVVRCIHPAADVGAGRPTRLPACADLTGIVSYRSHDVPTVTGPARGAGVGDRAWTGGLKGRVAQGKNKALAWVGCGKGRGSSGIYAPESIFPGVSVAQPLIARGWAFAYSVCAHPAVAAALRLIRSPARTLSLPSPVLRELLAEAVRREYERHWDALVDTQGRADPQVETRHFAVMVSLYEAHVEAEHCFFLSPSATFSVDSAQERVTVLTSVFRSMLSGACEGDAASVSEPSKPSEVSVARRQVWENVYRRYSSLWVASFDRLVLLHGIHLLDGESPEKRQEWFLNLTVPVNFLQITCNLLNCREELRRVNVGEFKTPHAYAADLALWSFVKWSASTALTADEEEGTRASHLLGELFESYFGKLAALADGGVERRSKVHDSESAGGLKNDDSELAVMCCAYALWQASRGNWTEAFRPVQSIGMAVFEQDATRMLSHVLTHLRMVHELRMLPEMTANGSTVPSGADADLDDDLSFGIRYSMVKAVAAYHKLARERANDEYRVAGDFFSGYSQMLQDMARGMTRLAEDAP